MSDRQTACPKMLLCWHLIIWRIGARSFGYRVRTHAMQKARKQSIKRELFALIAIASACLLGSVFTNYTFNFVVGFLLSAGLAALAYVRLREDVIDNKKDTLRGRGFAAQIPPKAKETEEQSTPQRSLKPVAVSLVSPSSPSVRSPLYSISFTTLLLVNSS